MHEPSSENQKLLAAKIALTANATEKHAIRVWIEHLLQIKESDLSPIQKAKQAVSITANSSIILSTVKIISRETKRHTWDNRGLSGRLGIGGAAVGLTLFSGQSAGIAALGTAIGVPLWVVFGAGASFLGVLYEEITGHKPPNQTTDE